MALITNDKTANSMAIVCKKYYLSKGMEIVKNVNILFSDNILNDRKKYIEINTDDDTEPNGCFIPTQDNIILINYKCINAKFVFPFITITHEIIHFADYNLFIKDFYNNDWSKLLLENNNFNITFHLWSEYHAKLLSLIDGRVIETLIDSDCKIDDIAWEFSLNEKIESYYKDIKNIKTITYYDIFTYCAQLYICEQYRSKFNIEEYIPGNLANAFPSFKSLYEDLKLMTTYEAAKDHLKLLKWKLFWNKT